MLAPTDLKWKPNPLVQGSEQAVLLGDPKKAGPYVMRIKFPPNFNNKPHTHPDDRVVTIISGTWNFGHGDTFDASKGKSLPQGTFFTEPANAVHYNFTKAEPVVIQIHGMGPTGTTPVKKAVVRVPRPSAWRQSFAMMTPHAVPGVPVECRDLPGPDQQDLRHQVQHPRSLLSR